ncbi:hypothetical protein [Burkholderia ambifaria]|uniref:hypothetical protein n=1 Tax=Burkholderia ambifaria TaxID=152480 RepID=UPI00158D5D5D|nr:hypothetical protein [Burkholderia ambifaria]
MKPYIFNYSDSVRTIFPESPDHRLQQHRPDAGSVLDSTVLTATVEPVDPDSAVLSTVITRSVEPNDTDQFMSASTYITESTEPADPDMIWLDSTIFTKSLEPADEDGIHPIIGTTDH